MLKHMLKRKVSRGWVIAFALIVLFVLSVLGFALGSRGTQNLSQVLRTHQLDQAYYAAQAGATLSIYSVYQSDPGIPAPGNTVPVSPSQSLTLQGQTMPYTLPNKSSFWVSLTNGPAVASDGTTVPANTVYIISHGTMNSDQKTTKVMLQYTIGTDYNYGVFGKDGISIGGGGTTDSYDSRCGAYNAVIPGPLPAGCTGTVGLSNIFQKGNVGTDANGNSVASLNGASTVVNGRVDVGTGGTAGAPTITVAGGATYDSARVLSSNVVFPSVSNPVTAADSGSYLCGNHCSDVWTPGATGIKYDDVTVKGTLTLNCGNYSFSSLTLAAGGTLQISAACSAANPVKIYVQGGVGNPIDTSGGSVANLSGYPAALQLFDLNAQPPGCNPVAPAFSSANCNIDKISGGAQADFTIFAPGSMVKEVGGGNIFGAIIGLYVDDSGGGTVHYDQALSQVPINATPAVTALFWNFQ